jgi:(p)ppGpp synthase/HD superfamily hydrolase
VEKTELIKKSRDFALQQHSGHTYGNGAPFITHLDDVYSVLKEFDTLDEYILVAAYLHDVLEDCKNITNDELDKEFGYMVTELVNSVTDEPGASRLERKLKTYPKIAGDKDAVRLKLADRIANTRAANKSRLHYLSTYIKEYPEFRRQLNDKEHNQDMWSELDTLMNSLVPRTFKLYRTEDVSGVSGTGIVAEGVIFTNGKCVVTWYGKISSITIYNTFTECEAIHGHEGKTKFLFDNYR